MFPTGPEGTGRHRHVQLPAKFPALGRVTHAAVATPSCRLPGGSLHGAPPRPNDTAQGKVLPSGKSAASKDCAAQFHNMNSVARPLSSRKLPASRPVLTPPYRRARVGRFSPHPSPSPVSWRPRPVTPSSFGTCRLPSKPSNAAGSPKWSEARLAVMRPTPVLR